MCSCTQRESEPAPACKPTPISRLQIAMATAMGSIVTIVQTRAAIGTFLFNHQPCTDNKHIKEVLTCSDNLTMEQKMSGPPEWPVPQQSVMSEKRKTQKVLQTVNNTSAEEGRNKVAHLSASGIFHVRSSLTNQLYPSHNAVPSAPGAVSFGAWPWWGGVLPKACTLSISVYFLQMHICLLQLEGLVELLSTDVFDLSEINKQA